MSRHDDDYILKIFDIHDRELDTIVSTTSIIFADTISNVSSISKPTFDLLAEDFPEYSIIHTSKPIKIELSDVGNLFINIDQPTFLILLIPLVGIIFVKSEKEKIKFYNFQRLFSIIFILILASSAAITLFSISALYWPYAYADTNMTEP